jgi:hypothetical protein
MTQEPGSRSRLLRQGSSRLLRQAPSSPAGVLISVSFASHDGVDSCLFLNPAQKVEERKKKKPTTFKKRKVLSLQSLASIGKKRKNKRNKPFF